MRVALILLLLTSQLSLARDSMCYYPNGTAAGSDGVLCNPDAQYSTCCRSEDACTIQGFCKNQVDDTLNNFYWRGTCTDPSWKSSACPRYCYNSTTDTRAATRDWLMWACSSTTYCCTANSSINDPSCCDKKVFDAGLPIFVYGYMPTPSIYPVIVVPLPSSGASPTQSSPSYTMSTSATTVASATPAPSSSSRGLSTVAKAGVGAGAAVGSIALLGLGAFAIFRLRKFKGRHIPEQTTESKELTSYEYPKATYRGWRYGELAEADSRWVVEANPDAAIAHRPVELAENQRFSELPGH